MKQIISLALKYIRRQKFRSLLTFLCITLSVFILCSTFMYMGSTIATFRNYQIENYGSWEVDLSDIINKSAKENPIEIIKNHALVEDYYIYNMNYIYLDDIRDENNKIGLYEIALDNGKTARVNRISHSLTSGNTKLNSPDITAENYDFKSDNEVYVPEWLRDYGYKEGDTISFKITPLTGAIVEDSQEVREIADITESEISEKKVNFNGNVLDEALFYHNFLKKYTYNDMILKNETVGKSSETITAKIAGFNKERTDIFSFISETNVKFDIEKLFDKNSEIQSKSNFIPYNNVRIRIIDGVNFDDAVKQLCTDLGISENDYVSDIETSPDVFHTELLSFEFKGAYALTSILPYIILFLIIIFLAWAIARFVIDNAFEISVQERSRQFAALRIMGASKSQLLALVLTEGAFYSITALPIGFFFATTICKNIFTSLNHVGLKIFEYEANPVFIIFSIALCAVGIFISSYTSAMWASRKLSPAEAMNYGKPKRKKDIKLKIHGKTKLNRSSKGFIFHYTKKNIKRSKSRFVISTITMTIGVLMFTFCAVSGIGINQKFNSSFEKYDRYDFSTYAYDIDYIEDAEKVLSDKKVFSDYSITCYIFCSSNEVRMCKLSQNIDTTHSTADSIQLHSVDRKLYEKEYEKLTGISYDTFISSGELIGISYIETKGEENYKTAEELGFSNENVIEMNNKEYAINGIIYSNRRSADTGLIYPIENINMIINNNSNLFPNIFINATVNGEKNYNEAEKCFNELCTGANIEPMYNEYLTNTGLKAFIGTIIKAILGFLISIWLVGILSMVNSINTSVLNRCPELSMLRSVGMSKKQLFGTVVIESITFSAISTIVGTILGIISSAFFLRYGYRISIGNILGTVVAITVVSLIVNLIIAFLAALPGVNILSRNIKHNPVQ